MTSLETEINSRVQAIILECIAKAEAKYKVKVAYPRVNYDLNGRIAGTANYRTWTVSLHKGLLYRESTRETILTRTLPHEMAHLICDLVYPDAHKTELVRDSRGGYKRTKRDVHGYRWQEIMRVLGVKDITRCHSMDVTEFSKPKTKHEYSCAKCNQTIVVGPKIHSQLVNSPMSRWHPSCRGFKLVYMGELGKVTYRQAREMMDQPKAPVTIVRNELHAANIALPKPVAPVKTEVMGPTGDSKAAKCWRLFVRYYGQYERAAIIEFFINEAKCTAAGASTYYSNCKALHAKGAI